jgi:hypothetical protein
VTDPRTNSAVSASDDVFPPDDLGVTHQAIGNRLRVLDKITVMTDDAGNEDFSIRQFCLFPHAPLMIVTWI